MDNDERATDLIFRTYRNTARGAKNGISQQVIAAEKEGKPFTEVADRSSALAKWLVDRGVTPEQRIYIVLPDTPAFAWAIFGTLAAGAVLTMGNPIAPVDDLAAVIDYVKAAVLITTPQVAAALAPRFGELPQLRDILLSPDAATGEDPEAARLVAKQHGASFKQTVGEALLKAGFPAVHAVGRASTRAPRLIELRRSDRLHAQ